MEKHNRTNKSTQKCDIEQSFSNCESREKILGSQNKLAFCAFQISFITIMFINNQKREKVKCHYTIVA